MTLVGINRAEKNQRVSIGLNSIEINRLNPTELIFNIPSLNPCQNLVQLFGNGSCLRAAIVESMFLAIDVDRTNRDQGGGGARGRDAVSV